jgi:hypothetical protein
MLLKPVARALGRKVLPDYYRPRAWYERNLSACDMSIVDYDSFGIFTFVPLSRSVARTILGLEARFVRSKRLKKYGVNYKLTIRRNGAAAK